MFLVCFDLGVLLIAFNDRHSTYEVVCTVRIDLTTVRWSPLGKTCLQTTIHNSVAISYAFLVLLSRILICFQAIFDLLGDIFATTHATIVPHSLQLKWTWSLEDSRRFEVQCGYAIVLEHVVFSYRMIAHVGFSSLIHLIRLHRSKLQTLSVLSYKMNVQNT